MKKKKIKDGKPIHELKRILMDPKQPQWPRYVSRKFHYVDKYGKPIVN
jgi:hypothetical protein